MILSLFSIDVTDASERRWTENEPPFSPGELAVFAVRWGPVKGGDISLEVRPLTELDGEPVWHFAGRAVSSGLVDALYPVDDSIEGLVDTAEFLPRLFEIRVDEKKERGRRTVIYDHDSGEARFELDRTFHKDDGPKQEQRVDELGPFAQDALSALYRLRMLPVRQVGKTYAVPIHEDGKNWQAEVTVGEVETLRDTPFGEIRAYPLELKVRFDGKLKTDRGMTAWIADAPHRALVRFRAGLKFGSLTGELRSFRRQTDTAMLGEPVPETIRPEPRLMSESGTGSRVGALSSP
ncbi:MAG: DUF3108 domain-containing protein [Acidobacteriota bacterium]